MSPFRKIMNKNQTFFPMVRNDKGQNKLLCKAMKHGVIKMSRSVRNPPPIRGFDSSWVSMKLATIVDSAKEQCYLTERRDDSPNPAWKRQIELISSSKRCMWWEKIKLKRVESCWFMSGIERRATLSMVTKWKEAWLYYVARRAAECRYKKSFLPEINR